MLYIGGMQTKYLGIGLGLIVGVVLILAVTNSLSYARVVLTVGVRHLNIQQMICGGPHIKPEIHSMQSVRADFGDLVSVSQE